MIVKEEKKILSDFCSRIPESVYGPDRVAYILENSGKLKEEDIVLLRKFINRILTSMIERDPSDIEIGGHGNEGYIWMRIYGKLERVKDLPQLSEDESALLIANMFNSNQKKYIAATRNLDFSYTFFYERRKINVRFRADAYFDLDTLACSMRAINTNIRPLASLDFHQNAIKYLSHSYIKFGLTLVTGITGSGKSTTLDSIVDYHNKFDPAHLIIIAAPIEYVHSSNYCLIKHREVGRWILRARMKKMVNMIRQAPRPRTPVSVSKRT